MNCDVIFLRPRSAHQGSVACSVHFDMGEMGKATCFVTPQQREGLMEHKSGCVYTQENFSALVFPLGCEARGVFELFLNLHFPCCFWGVQDCQAWALRSLQIFIWSVAQYVVAVARPYEWLPNSLKCVFSTLTLSLFCFVFFWMLVWSCLL